MQKYLEACCKCALLLLKTDRTVQIILINFTTNCFQVGHGIPLYFVSCEYHIFFNYITTITFSIELRPHSDWLMRYYSYFNFSSFFCV